MKVLDLEGLGYFWTKIKNKFYIKPDTGIPKSDLSSEVQGSLNKADTALLTETDPIFTASPAHGISSEDIVRWNNLESLGISTLSLSIDSSTYVLTLSGTKIDGTSFVVPNPVDLPLESVVVSGSYDSVNKKVILTLKDGSTIEFSIADLISGLQEEITPSNKLSADLIEDGVTNKVVTLSEKTTWNNKSDFSGSYNDLTDKPHIPNDLIQSDWNLSDSTQVDYIKNKPTNVSSFNNDAGYLTEHQSLSNYYTKSETDNLLDDKADTSDLATVATSGDYNDLTNKPTIPSAQVNSDWNATSGVAQILNKPDIPNVSQVVDTGTSITVGSTSYNVVSTYSPSGNADTYTAPSWSAMSNAYSELNFRTHVDDTSIGVNADDELYVKSLSADRLTNGTNNKVFTASELTKLTGIAAGAEVNVLSDWNETNTSSDAFIKNKPTIPDAQIQSDWNQTTTTAADYIKNKPDIVVDSSNNDMTINGHNIAIDSDDIGLYSNGMYLNAIGGSINFNAGVENDQLKIYGDEGVFIEGANNKNIKLTTSGNGKAYYNNNEIATKNDIPTNVSAFTNDAGYLTSYTETDPTVPAWAKASTKPTYTAAEVGALPDTTVIPDAPGTLNTNNSTAQTVSSSESLSGTINLHKISKSGNYNDLLNKPSIPVDSDLVHTTGDEQISGNKTFRANGNIRLLSGWNQIYNEDDSESLLQALNLRNNVQSDWNATTGDAVILNKPTIPTVNNSTITILKNSSTVDSFTLNQNSNKTINITVPTTASDVSALPASTKYGASLSVSIDSTTYVVTALLKDLDGNNLGTAQTIDLPLESVVVSGSYDSATKKVVLTLKDGSTIDFSIADLVSGLLTEITSTNKLSADLVEDGTTNKVYTATEKTKLSGIASGAEVNVQSDWNVTNTSSDAYILNKPDLSIYAQSSNLATVATSGSYNDLSDKPTIPTVNNGTLSISGPSGGSTVTTDVFHANLSGDSLIAFSPGTNTTINVNSSTRTITIGTTAEPNVQSNWNETNTSSDAYILNKPTIPLVLDNPQGTETDAAPSVRYVENIRSEVDFRLHVDGTSIDVSADDDLYVKSLSADKLTNGTNNKVFTSAEQLKLTGIEIGAQVNVQSDWNETNVLSDAYILNKPTIPDITGKADKVSSAVEGNFASLDSNGNLEDSGYSYTDCLNELSDLYTPATESSELEPGDTFEEAFGKLEKTVTDNEYITAQALNDLNTNKQDTLESGTNIKTINGSPVLGSGDISVQNTLESGTNIKTINGDSILGSGNLSIAEPTITVGTTTTVGAMSNAAVTNSGTASDPIFDFTIPSGCYGIFEWGSTDTTKTISPLTMNMWGEVASLDITLATPSNVNIVNEYMFSFNSGSTATVLSLPADVKFTSTVTIETNKHYECNIIYDANNEEYYGVIIGWAWSAS